MFDKWSGALMEKLNETFFDHCSGGWRDRLLPQNICHFSFWKDKPFAKKYLTIVAVFGRTKL